MLQRTGAEPLVMTGMTLGLVAMILLTRLTPDGAYASHVLPGLLLTGLAMGCIFAPAFSTATLGVKSTDAGIASAMVNTSQQVGGSVGTALLSTIFASAAASYASAHTKAAGLAGAASIHGYTTAFDWCVVDRDDDVERLLTACCGHLRFCDQPQMERQRAEAQLGCETAG